MTTQNANTTTGRSIVIRTDSGLIFADVEADEDTPEASDRLFADGRLHYVDYFRTDDAVADTVIVRHDDGFEKGTVTGLGDDRPEDGARMWEGDVTYVDYWDKGDAPKPSKR